MTIHVVAQPVSNQLLGSLPPEKLDGLASQMERVPLAFRQVLHEPNKPIGFAYFIEQGMASVIAHPGTAHAIEVGIIGREGMVGLPLVLGSDTSPFEVFIQLAGSGLRVSAAALREAMAEHEELRTGLLAYAQSFLLQTSGTAYANGRHSIEERLARWLLMCHDRVDGDVVPVTHEFLALMLGIRRAGVTTAVNVLEGAKIVRGNRGRIEILDREELKANAGDSYGAPEAEYERLMAG